MGKTLYTSVSDLEPFGGVKPVGVQNRVKCGTGPFIPRFIEGDEGVILIVECQRGDLTLKELDGNKVVRIDLDATEILEWTDKEAAHDAIRLMRGERDRARSEASGYDGTFDEPGRAVHADADGTVLTPQEVAARQGLDAGPSLEEAQAWWDEQSYVAGAFGEVAVSTVVDLVGRIPLNEVEYVAVLEREMCKDDAPGEESPVAAAVAARLLAHAEATEAPGWSPLEDGLPIAEARSRIANQGDVRIVLGWLEAERGGKGRKRLLAALAQRLDELDPGPEPEVAVPVDKAEADAVEHLAAVPPLPGEDEPGFVDEEPFG